MSDDGSTKDDVKAPEGDIGDKINKLFSVEGKDTSKDASAQERAAVSGKLTAIRRYYPYRYG